MKGIADDIRVERPSTQLCHILRACFTGDSPESVLAGPDFELCESSSLPARRTSFSLTGLGPAMDASGLSAHGLSDLRVTGHGKGMLECPLERGMWAAKDGGPSEGVKTDLVCPLISEIAETKGRQARSPQGRSTELRLLLAICSIFANLKAVRWVDGLRP